LTLRSVQTRPHCLGDSCLPRMGAAAAPATRGEKISSIGLTVTTYIHIVNVCRAAVTPPVPRRAPKGDCVSDKSRGRGGHKKPSEASRGERAAKQASKQASKPR